MGSQSCESMRCWIIDVISQIDPSHSRAAKATVGLKVLFFKLLLSVPSIFTPSLTYTLSTAGRSPKQAERTTARRLPA